MKHRSVLLAALGLGFMLSAAAPAFAEWHGGHGGWHGGGWHGGWHHGWGWRGGYWGPRVVVGGGYPYYYPYYYPYPYYAAPGITVRIP